MLFAYAPVESHDSLLLNHTKIVKFAFNSCNYNISCKILTHPRKTIENNIYIPNNGSITFDIMITDDWYDVYLSFDWINLIAVTMEIKKNVIDLLLVFLCQIITRLCTDDETATNQILRISYRISWCFLALNGDIWRNHESRTTFSNGDRHMASKKPTKFFYQSKLGSCVRAIMILAHWWTHDKIKHLFYLIMVLTIIIWRTVMEDGNSINFSYL